MQELSDTVSGKTQELIDAENTLSDAQDARREAEAVLSNINTKIELDTEALRDAEQTEQTRNGDVGEAETVLEQVRANYNQTYNDYQIVLKAEEDVETAKDVLEKAKETYENSLKTIQEKEDTVKEKEQILKDDESACIHAETVLKEAEEKKAEKETVYHQAEEIFAEKEKELNEQNDSYEKLLQVRNSYEEAEQAVQEAEEALKQAKAKKEAAQKKLSDAQDLLKIDIEERDNAILEYQDAMQRIQEALEKTIEDLEKAEEVLKEKKKLCTDALADYTLAKEVTQSFLPMQYKVTVSNALVVHLDKKQIGYKIDNRENNIKSVLVNGRTINKGNYKYDPKAHSIVFSQKYIDSLSAGKYSVTFRFALGSGSAAFFVNARDIAGTTVSKISDQKYTGKEIKVLPTIKYGNTVLKKDVDYQVTYKNNTKPGTATITVKGIKGFKGTKIITFKIESAVKKTALYRLYNPRNGEHFYTVSVSERDVCVRNGWRYEGVNSMQPVKSDIPVYRLYNPNNGEHFFTRSTGERDNLKKAGWKYEGVGFYSCDSKGQKVYRLYNPNAKHGQHHFTSSYAEYEYLVSAGWKGERIAWYAVK